jgi:peptidyl-prolyl cis-trans isomerase SurA
MRIQFSPAILLLLAVTMNAQVASHPASASPSAEGALPPARVTTLQVTGKTVAKVNGAVLSDRDLVREMFAIFPYAKQHNGFPEKLEPQIRKGALDMIIFEELVYQEAKHRNMSISVERITREEREFRKQFPSPEVYQQFLKEELKGSRQLLREKIRRSLLIESLLNLEVVNKAKVTAAEVRSLYEKNPRQFAREEQFHIQTISILPPANGSADISKEARRRAQDAAQQAKSKKSYQEFGLLAEKISDDDYRVNMGDHKPCGRDQLPPEVVKTALAMKPGEVSDLIQLGTAFTVIRLVVHTPAGKIPYTEVKGQVQSDLQRERVEKLRAALGKKLRQGAKIETL